MSDVVYPSFNNLFSHPHTFLIEQKIEYIEHEYAMIGLVILTSADTVNKMYCTSAYKAMRLAFLLKKRLGIGISDNSFAIAAALGIAQVSLVLLSFARYLPRTPITTKAPQGAAMQEVQKSEPAPVEEKPKKKRGRKPKAEKAA